MEIGLKKLIFPLMWAGGKKRIKVHWDLKINQDFHLKIFKIFILSGRNQVPEMYEREEGREKVI